MHCVFKDYGSQSAGNADNQAQNQNKLICREMSSPPNVESFVVFSEVCFLYCFNDVSYPNHSAKLQFFSYP